MLDQIHILLIFKFIIKMTPYLIVRIWIFIKAQQFITNPMILSKSLYQHVNKILMLFQMNRLFPLGMEKFRGTQFAGRDDQYRTALGSQEMNCSNLPQQLDPDLLEYYSELYLMGSSLPHPRRVDEDSTPYQIGFLMQLDQFRIPIYFEFA